MAGTIIGILALLFATVLAIAASGKQTDRDIARDLERLRQMPDLKAVRRKLWLTEPTGNQWRDKCDIE